MTNDTQTTQNPNYPKTDRNVRFWDPKWSDEAPSLPDPADVQRYAGQTFITETYKMYNITEEGRFIGEDSIRGSKIKKIGGITSGNKAIFEEYILRKDRINAEHLLYQEAKTLRSGLCLAITLDEESERKTGISGFVTAPIKEIINIK